ncbi:MAG TPA: hypothetical protein V6D11_03665 [Waterburya sp.]
MARATALKNTWAHTERRPSRNESRNRIVGKVRSRSVSSGESGNEEAMGFYPR